MDLTRRIRDKMMKERLMFAYRGVVTNENSIPLLMLLEKEMENSEFGFVGRKRLFMFVLESLQNVSRHGSGVSMQICRLWFTQKLTKAILLPQGMLLQAEQVRS